MDIAAALWGGIFGAIAAAVVYVGFLALHWTRFDLLRFEGGLLARERSNMVYVYGALVQVVLGAALALGYRSSTTTSAAATTSGPVSRGWRAVA